MRDKVRQYKCRNQEKVISSVLVTDKEKKVCAYLVPVTEKIFEYSSVIEKLVEWRRDNPTVSNNYFEVTRVGTENWLKRLY